MNALQLAMSVFTGVNAVEISAHLEGGLEHHSDEASGVYSACSYHAKDRKWHCAYVQGFSACTAGSGGRGY